MAPWRRTIRRAVVLSSPSRSPARPAECHARIAVRAGWSWGTDGPSPRPHPPPPAGSASGRPTPSPMCRCAPPGARSARSACRRRTAARRSCAATPVGSTPRPHESGRLDDAPEVAPHIGVILRRPARRREHQAVVLPPPSCGLARYIQSHPVRLQCVYRRGTRPRASCRTCSSRSPST